MSTSDTDSDDQTWCQTLFDRTEEDDLDTEEDLNAVEVIGGPVRLVIQNLEDLNSVMDRYQDYLGLLTEHQCQYSSTDKFMESDSGSDSPTQNETENLAIKREERSQSNVTISTSDSITSDSITVTDSTTIYPEFRLHYNPSRSFVWPSAKLVSELIASYPNLLIKNKRVLELGSGLGLPSITSAVLGAELVVATDLEARYLKSLDRLVGMEKNKKEWENLKVMTKSKDMMNDSSSSSNCSLDLVTERLDWFEALSVTTDSNIKHSVFSKYPDPFDIVLAADVNYHPDTVDALTQTVKLSGADMIILVSREKRAGFDGFAKKLKEEVFEEVVVDRERIFCEKRGIGVVEEERHSLFVFRGRKKVVGPN